MYCKRLQKRGGSEYWNANNFFAFKDIFKILFRGWSWMSGASFDMHYNVDNVRNNPKTSAASLLSKTNARICSTVTVMPEEKKTFPTRLRKSLITFLFAELFSIFLGVLVAKCQDHLPHYLQLQQALQRRENLVQLPRGPLFRVQFKIFFYK